MSGRIGSEEGAPIAVSPTFPAADWEVVFSICLVLIMDCSPRKNRSRAKLWLSALKKIRRRDLEFGVIGACHLGGRLGASSSGVKQPSDLGGRFSGTIVGLLCQ